MRVNRTDLLSKKGAGKIEIIKDNETVLAIVHRNEDWAEGLHFATPDDFYIQAGTWCYSKGKILGAHRHIENIRTVHRTQEVTYVKRGRIRISLYSDAGVLVRDIELSEGDYAVMAAGGHGYEILEDNTQVLEVKNGPFFDVSRDKAPIVKA